ncbi:TonB-dependent receptor plug domain-containing protein [Aquirufa sp. 5-AUSEE-100C1]
MNIGLISVLGFKMAIFCPSDTLDNVVVSASRQAISKQQVVYPIHQKKIMEGASMNSPEILATSSGVFVQRTNQGGGSAFVRGLTGNQTLLVLDGIRFNNSTFRYGPNQYLNTIDPYSLNQVEILRGAGSVQYGSDALTGVIHLISNKPTFSANPKWSGQMIGRAISQGMEQSVLGRLNYQMPNFAFSTSLSNKSFGDITRGGVGGFQRPTGYDERNGIIQFHIKLGDRWVVENLFQQTVQDRVPVYHKIQLENFAINEMTLQSYGRAFSRWIYSGGHSWNQQMDWTLSYQKSREKRLLKKKGSSISRQEEDVIGTFGLVGQLKSNWSSNLSSMSGIEVYADAVQSSRIDISPVFTTHLRGLYPNDSVYQTFSAFSLHEWQGDKWHGHAGLRYQNSMASLPDSTVGDSRISSGALVYDGGFTFSPNSSINLFMSFSTGFRAPNLDDLGSLGIVDFRYELPAYQLSPEYSLTKNLGVRLSKPNWNFELSGFHTQLSQLINRVKTTQVVQGYPLYLKENNAQAYLVGFESESKIRLSEKLSLTNSLSYVYGQNISLNEPMRRIPPLHGSLVVDYTFLKGSLGFIWQFADRQDRLSAGDKADNRMNPSGTAGWGIWQISYSYKISPYIHFSMQGMNLGNVPYRMHGSGIDGMGRSLHAQMIFNW